MQPAATRADFLDVRLDANRAFSSVDFQRWVLSHIRPMPNSKWSGIYAFEVASSTEWSNPSIGNDFRPDRFVNIEATIERKMAALKAYDEEMRPFPHSRSYDALLALATLRGAHVGLKSAEAFLTLRSIDR